MYCVNGKHFADLYRNKLSGYHDWCMDELGCGFYFNAANVGPYMSLDETCLSNGEVWTSLTNKEGKGGKGTLAAAIPGTRSDEIHNTSIINYFEQRLTNASAGSFNAKKRRSVRSSEVSEMSNSSCTAYRNFTVNCVVPVGLPTAPVR